jgi:hypothetical protein
VRYLPLVEGFGYIATPTAAVNGDRIEGIWTNVVTTSNTTTAVGVNSFELELLNDDASHKVCSFKNLRAEEKVTYGLQETLQLSLR